MVIMEGSQKKSKPSNTSNAEYPDGMAEKMLKMLKAVENLEKIIDPIISKPHQEVCAKLNCLNRSKMGALDAFAVNSLFWVLMKTSKDDVETSLEDDFKLEMIRLKDLQGRIKGIEEKALRPVVDRAAASRFIRRGVGQPNGAEEAGPNPRKKARKAIKPENCESESFRKAWQ